MKNKTILLLTLVAPLLLQTQSFANTLLVKAVVSNDFDNVNFEREVNFYDDGSVVEVVGPILIPQIGFQSAPLATLSPVALDRFKGFVADVNVNAPLQNLSDPQAQACMNTQTIGVYLESGMKETLIHQNLNCQEYAMVENNTVNEGAARIAELAYSFIDFAK